MDLLSRVFQLPGRTNLLRLSCIVIGLSLTIRPGFVQFGRKMTNAAERKFADLYLVATPIGQPDDLSPRAARLLLEADLVIGEEWRELTTLLKRLGRERKSESELAVLNEHTRDTDWAELLERMSKLPPTAKIALVSDCGTPGFCDPGGRLVGEWRARGARVSTAPGASSLMCLLALSGIELREFNFVGFPPVEREARQQRLDEVVQDTRAQVLMDTPYRLQRLLEELAERDPSRMATLGTNFTCDNESVWQARLAELLKLWQARSEGERKAEFMLLLHPLERDGAARAASKIMSSPRGAANPNPRPSSAEASRPATRSPANRPTKPANSAKHRRGR